MISPLEFLIPDSPQAIFAQIIGFAVAIILHEVAHGYVALRLGDPTAYYSGRLTLNPIKHIDIWGSVVIPLLLILSQAGFVFGWAKPVPVNYYNLKHGKYGPTLVALAGPATNLIILIVCGLLVRVVPAGTALPAFFFTVAAINGLLMLFNLIPIPPLDGSKVLYLFLENRPDIIGWLERYSFYLLIGILVFGGPLLSSLVFVPALRLAMFVAGVTGF